MPKDYRSRLLPTNNSTLVKMDYKAMELVTAAYLSKDKKLLLAIEQEDPYLAIFEMAFGLYQDKEQARERAKAIILPLIYGSGRKKLAMALGVEEHIAEGAEKAIWRTFSDLHEWLAVRESEACSGSITDSIGRVRFFPTDVFKARHHCISSPSVGHCLDRLCRLSEDKDIRLVLNVHDEFVFEIEKNDKKIVNKIKDILLAPSVFVEGAKYNISISSF
jgi:DNA polymerase I-like protein with 3'-5' exonuclease and polymerase domains